MRLGAEANEFDWIEFFRFCCRDASIQRLGGMQLTDARYKVRTTNPTTILEQFLRGRGAITGLSLLMDDAHCSVSEINWQYTLVPLVNIIGQLM